EASARLERRGHARSLLKVAWPRLTSLASGACGDSATVSALPENPVPGLRAWEVSVSLSGHPRRGGAGGVWRAWPAAPPSQGAGDRGAVERPSTAATRLGAARGAQGAAAAERARPARRPWGRRTVRTRGRP